jgi:FkbM family methyltransferase
MASQLRPGTTVATLFALMEMGVKYATVIDIGCADGHFFLSHFAAGLFPGSTVLNIDANPIYEGSLRAIKDVMGGHYFIGAVTDRNGEVELTTGAHPYWNSLRPPGDTYWSHLNRLHVGTMRVPAVTVDSLADTLQLKPPFLIKLDIQGAEVEALRGATRVLQETEVVICEADLEDFHSIDRALFESGFNIFDITDMQWLPDRTLGWFYPVYLHRRLDHLRQRRAFWNEAENAQVIQIQANRRKAVLEYNAAVLAQQRTLRGRN